MTRSPSTPITTIVAIALAVYAFGEPLAAVHPNQPQGFDPERSAERGADDIDHIDLYTGRLSLILPMGPFAFHYNSNVWRYATVVENNNDRIHATVDSLSTGGIGWHLGLGEVFRPQHPYNTTGRWLFVSEDGGRHEFYDTLHNDDNNAQVGIWYSRDGSYLRLRKTASHYVDIEFPDGRTRRFATGAAFDPSIFTLHKVWSRFTSPDDPDLWVTHDSDDLQRTVHDRYGRQHHLRLTDAYAPRFPRTVTQVDIESFGGQRLIYDLEYIDQWVSTSCKADAVSTPDRIRVPHLKRIDNRADGTAYTFFADGELLYYNTCENGIEDLPGILRGANLPTGGKIRWVFQEYDFPPSESTQIFNSSAGVASRTLLNFDGTPYGGENATWTYKTTKISAAQTGGHPEMHTEVVSPTGDCTKHFFDAIYWTSTATGEGWERGLPFVYTESVDGRFLSAQVYPSNDGQGACDGDPLRSTYLRFRRDLTPGPSAPISDWSDLNRQVAARRVTYHDDEDRYRDTAYGDFDGLGNFRHTVTTGTFRDDSTTAERREAFTHYNRVSGTYFTAGYEPPDPEDPWILRIFDSMEVTDDDAVGESTSRIEYGLEPDTGFVFCSRTLAAGTARGTQDVMQTFERNALGQVTDQKLYGGDKQPLATSGADCGQVPTQPAYWTTDTYQFGRLRTSQPRTVAGDTGPFLTYDVDLDPSTGQIVNQRNANGFQVTYAYDAMGRVVSVTPDQGARTEFDYIIANAGTQASAITTVRSQAGNQVLGQQEVVVDDFGRQRLERRSMPGGDWSEREVRYNARGWRTTISQRGDLNQTTQFLDYDAFGRAATVRPPDGPDHDLLVDYQGDRRLHRKTKVAVQGGEAYVTRSYSYDRYGRLRAVEEPSGADGAMTTSIHDYDVAGRLTRLTVGAGPAQVRTFTYDNRGFMLAESHPEKGPTGGGSVRYLDYDAGGLPGRRIDGPNDLVLSYDVLGRLLQARDRSHGNRLLTDLRYDTAPGLGLGKVATATRYNYIDLPWNAQAEESVRLEQQYRYDGLGGAPSGVKTRLFDWDLGVVSFDQAYAYDDLGVVDRVTYPRCTLAACGGTSAGTGRQVAATFDQGFITAVDGWAPEITYHPSGMWKSIHHANGVVDHQERGTAYSQRPRRRFTQGALPATVNFDSGIMTYDGAHNLAEMGSDTFTYDQVGRLVKATFPGDDLTETYGYDRFGNLTERTTDDFGAIETRSYAVDPATNRLNSGATYDAAGNLTALGEAVFAYNTSNRLTRQGPMSYLYDAAGERIVSIPNAGHGTVSMSVALRDLGHRVLSRILFHNGTWRRDRDYVYAGGQLLARTEHGPAGQEASYHMHADHLGSTRLTTRADGTRRADHFFLPFGEEWTGGDPPDQDDAMLFTGHERDVSMGTDSMHARQYAPGIGRFMSVDPKHGNHGQPQSWNRYAYVYNSPMTFTDPDGKAGKVKWRSEELQNPIGLWAWFNTSSPIAYAKKTVIFGLVIPVGFVGGMVADIATTPFRLIPAVDRKIVGLYGYDPYPLANATVEALSIGYFEAIVGTPIAESVKADNGEELEPIATFSEEIEVVGDPPKLDLIHPKADSEDEEERRRRDALDERRHLEALRSQRELTCTINASLCYRGSTGYAGYGGGTSVYSTWWR